MNRKDRQSGSIIVPVLIVAIIIVAFLLWRSVALESPTSGKRENVVQNDGQVGADTQTQNESQTPATGRPEAQRMTGEEASIKAKEFYESYGKEKMDRAAELDRLGLPRMKDTTPAEEANAIKTAADELLSKNAPDYSLCRSMSDPKEALECAGSAESTALTAAFSAHNELRAGGDELSLQRGGDIMQRVIDELQESLAPFMEAANP